MDEKEFDYINVIPFIDIMLVLLTIVLTTSTFIAQGTIHMDLPKVSSNRQENTLKAISIEIDRQGNLYLNSSRMSLAGLTQGVRSFSAETPVLIRADKGIALQVFVDVMDMIRNTGFKKLSLQTEVKK
jgi:biopolymer transport protein ExbD